MEEVTEEAINLERSWELGVQWIWGLSTTSWCYRCNLGLPFVVQLELEPRGIS